MSFVRYNTDGIILDVDGTLWDSTAEVAIAWNNAVKMAGLSHEPLTAEGLKGLFGKPMNEIIDALFPDASEEEKARFQHFAYEEEGRVLREGTDDIMYPGVVETMRSFYKEVPFYIVSNCQEGYIECLLDRFDLRREVYDWECYGNTGLGKAENIKLLVERNEIKAPVYIGDTDMDRKACWEAKVPFIFAKYGFGQIERGSAFFEIDKFADIMDLF